jgi:hypothetical protein
VAPKSLTDDGRPPDTRLSTLIDQARLSTGAEASLEQRNRARADPVFSTIAGAIERGLRTLDPRSSDAAVLERLRDELRSR